MILGIDVASMILGGLAAGMVLFVVSVGLSVTMGLMGFVNLAHGAFAMLGGYVTVALLKTWQWSLAFPGAPAWLPFGRNPIIIDKSFEMPLWLALPLAALIVGAFSILLERTLYRRLYKATELDQVLFTIGLVLAATATVTLVVGPENQTIPLPPDLQGQLDLGIVQYRTYSLLLIGLGVIIMLALRFGFERTRMGARIRAAVDNARMAESLGINIGRLFTLTFAFGSAMAALGGGLGAEFLGLDPQYPLKYLVLFLIVVAVGGVGRITGVFYAALIIGVLDFALKSNVLNLLLERLGGESVLVRVLSGTMTYLQRGSMLFIYLLTILLLLWRPRGLFGKAA